MTSTPAPVRKLASLEFLVVATVNMAALALGLSAEWVVALNVFGQGIIGVIAAFWLHEQVTPVEGLHDRLNALLPPETP
jgi:hypothetical protein